MRWVWGHRFWVGAALACLCGLYLGLTFPYRSLFGGTKWRLYHMLIAPAIMIGCLSGWRAIVNCIVLYLSLSTPLLLRCLIGRDVWWDYFTFVFGLSFGCVADITPLLVAWAYLGALLSGLAAWMIARKKGPNNRVEGTLA